jgi:hypothetical protein
MNLLQQAEADNAMILEDDVTGFGRSVTLNDGATPTPHVYNVKGQVTRVGVQIDPSSGLPIPGNTCAITLRISTLMAAAVLLGLAGSAGIPVEGWGVSTTDSTGATVAGKIKGVMLDRTAGRVTFQVRI